MLGTSLGKISCKLKGGCAGVQVHGTSYSASEQDPWENKHWKSQSPMSPFIFNHNFHKHHLVKDFKFACFCVPPSGTQSYVWAAVTDSTRNPSSFLAVLDGEILRQCARLWFLYVYFCSSRRCPSAAVIPHMLHIGTFHRFRQFSAIDVFQVRCTTFVPADLIHLFQLWGRSAGVYRKCYITERLLVEMLVLSAQSQSVPHML